MRVLRSECCPLLTPVNARIGNRSDQADRVVVLITEKLDTSQAVGAEVKAVRSRTTSQRAEGANALNRRIDEEGVVPSRAIKRTTGITGADAVCPGTTENQLV